MAKKYKIAVVAACPFPYPRGTPIRILRMAEGLAARGHEVHVVTYHLGQKIEDLPFSIHRIRNIPTYHKLTPGPTYQKIAVLDILLAAKLFQVVHNAGFDIIHAHHYEGLLAGLPVARLTHTPVVFDVHTLLASELPHYSMGLSPRALFRIGDRLDHWLPRQADHIATVTNVIRTKLIDEIKLSSEKVTTIYGGIEEDHFAARTTSETDSASRTLIYTGNLAPYQGIDLMLGAFRKVLNRHPDVVLKIITDFSIGPYAKLIESLDLQDHLVVENADYFDLPNHLYSAQIALNPRVHCDGLPLKLLNYMATARAIVSFAGSAEILEPEHSGLIVQNGDSDAFAAAIIRLLENPPLIKTLGENARSHVNEFFVWKSSIESLETIYGSLLEQRA